MASLTSLISLAMKVDWFPIVQPHAMQIAFGPITWNTFGKPGCGTIQIRVSETAPHSPHTVVGSAHHRHPLEALRPANLVPILLQLLATLAMQPHVQAQSVPSDI